LYKYIPQCKIIKSNSNLEGELWEGTFSVGVHSKLEGLFEGDKFELLAILRTKYKTEIKKALLNGISRAR
jgi:hypothetical protein